MAQPTLFQLRCFEAVATLGGFKPAAVALARSHPSVFDAVKKLEAHLGLPLFDREGYRVRLNEAGRSLLARVQGLLADATDLQNYATQLAMGEESALDVVIGDICPLPQVFALLKRFFDRQKATRLHLHFEAITGPWERLADGEADLILHHIDKADPTLEFVNLCPVRLVPVAAPGFLPFPVGDAVTPEQMRRHVQCVIRDTARHSERRDYFLIEGAPSWTVSDQLMKKEVILQGMGWGHMPSFMVHDAVEDGRLVALTGKYLRGGRTDLVAARKRSAAHGPVATRLWKYLSEQAPDFRRALEAASRAPQAARRKRRAVSKTR